jgi:hypothetical protein
MREAKLSGRFLVYVHPKPLSYGLSSKSEVWTELKARIEMVCGPKMGNMRKIQRPLYPMQLVSFAPNNILQMATGPATSIYKSYTAVDLPNGPILYIEENSKHLYLFVLSTGEGHGLSQLQHLI